MPEQTGMRSCPCTVPVNCRGRDEGDAREALPGVGMRCIMEALRTMAESISEPQAGERLCTVNDPMP